MSGNRKTFAARLRGSALIATLLATAAIPGAAIAQDSESDARATGDIIVTARKRVESELKVPVIANILSSERLEQTQSVELKDIAKLAPGVQLGDSILAIGTQVSIRGVGTTTLDPGVDQSVALNIDGLFLGQGLAYTSGTFDLGQVEVLKGPQSLFFGKGSPGGVISLRTADPDAEAEIIGRAAYEFEAHTRRGELIVSGPLTDTLGLRVAGMYEKSDGYFFNRGFAQPGTGARTPSSNRLSPSKSYVLRGTALWNPDPAISVRLKANLVYDKILRPGTVQLVNCPDGKAGFPGVNVPGAGQLLQPLQFVNPDDQCRQDRNAYQVDYDPASYPGVPNNGVPFNRTKQRYGTLEVTAHPTDQLTLSSVTGYYWVRAKGNYNISQSGYAGPIFTFQDDYRRHDLTQELRLDSDFNGAINFTLGSFYQSAKVHARSTLIANRAYGILGLPDADGQHNMKIDSLSFFGQLRFKPIEQIELAAGGRYTDESRRDDPVLFLPTGILPVQLPTPRIQSSSFSPEITLSYLPNDDLTLFAAYKRGFKSGSYNISTVVPGIENSFDDEKAKGGEIGLKSRLLDRSLNLNLSAYRYKYSGLQIGVVEATAPGQQVTRTLNAGKSRIYGAELDLRYAPPALEGLTINAAVAWTKGKFTDLEGIPCYGGQLASEGCVAFGANGGVAQSLDGLQLVRAPGWQGNFGFSYEMPVSDAWSIVLTNDNQFSSRYLAAISDRDDVIQKSYLKFDLGLTLKSADRRWEFAVIGKNLNDVIRSGNCVVSNLGWGLLGGQSFGGTTRGPSGLDEGGCILDRGRSIWLRLTLRPIG